MTDEQLMPQHIPDHADDTAEELPPWIADMDGASEPVEQKFSALGVVFILVIVGVLGVVAFALYERNRPTPNEGPAPDFAVTAWDFEGLALPGERLTLDSLEGQVIVVNFWASWCIPCRQEAPIFERVWNEYRDRGVVFIGVNTEDTDASALGYIEEFGLTYPHAPDEGGRMEEDYRITGIPETFIINGDGQIMHHFISSPRDADALRDQIDRALES